MPKINRSKEEEVCRLYLEKMLSANKISSLLSIDPSTVYKVLQRNNIPRITNKERYKQDLNHLYFKTIDSPRKAYWLGLFTADGQVQKVKQSSLRVRIDLKEEDSYLIHEFAKDLNYKNPKILSLLNNNGTKHNRIVIASDEMGQDLSQYGVIPNKTFSLTWPELLLEEYASSFIRGVFDGDGYISKDGRHFKISGTKKLLLAIQERLVSNCGFAYTKLQLRHKDRKNKTWSLEYGGRYQMITLREYLYSNADMFMKRKKQRFYNE